MLCGENPDFMMRQHLLHYCRIDPELAFGEVRQQEANEFSLSSVYILPSDLH
jgi:hypothetical protein